MCHAYAYVQSLTRGYTRGIMHLGAFLGTRTCCNGEQSSKCCKLQFLFVPTRWHARAIIHLGGCLATRTCCNGVDVFAIYNLSFFVLPGDWPEPKYILEPVKEPEPAMGSNCISVVTNKLQYYHLPSAFGVGCDNKLYPGGFSKRGIQAGCILGGSIGAGLCRGCFLGKGVSFFFCLPTKIRIFMYIF